jgi:uncharacterized membrane protein
MMFAMCYLVDKKMPVIDAIRASIALVMRNLFPFVGLSVIVGAIAAAGVFACCVGVFASAPLAGCIIVVAYRAVEGGGPSAVTSSEPIEPQVIPPAA